MFIYCNKLVTISGTTTTTSGPSDNEEYVEKDNFTLVKGWNEVVCKVTKYTTTSNNLKQEITLTNAVTSDLKWRFIPKTSLSNASATRSTGVPQLKSFQLNHRSLLFKHKKKFKQLLIQKKDSPSLSATGLISKQKGMPHHTTSLFLFIKTTDYSLITFRRKDFPSAVTFTK